jgi:hypothetical protein
MEGFADLRAEWAEDGPNHECKVEVEKRGEKRGPVSGFFEIREFQGGDRAKVSFGFAAL